MPVKSHWDELSDLVDGQMRMVGKRKLLMLLIGKSASPSNQKLAIDRVLHEAN